MLYKNRNKIPKFIYRGNPIKLILPNNNTQNPPISPAEYWEAPIQEASTYKPWNYLELISKYDELVAHSPDYITKYRYEKNGVPVLTKNGNLEMFHYVLEPEKYTKTFFIQAGIHGNEMDAKQQLLKVVNILVNKVNEPGYEDWKNIRNNVRLVIIPCVSPYGHETSKMNIPYNDVQGGINPNRNYDFNHQYAIPAAGVGGSNVMELEECQHTFDVINKIGLENIDYAMDWHDGGAIQKHFWINYSVDGYNRNMVNNLVAYFIDKFNIENPIIPDCKDGATSGIASMFFAKSLGLNGSVVEWLGGLLGYDFQSDQMTKSLELRGNMILQAYKLNKKGWEIYEEPSQQYFKFDYPKAFTVDSLRQDAAEDITKVTDDKIYSRWDKLQIKYPSLITKSAKLGLSSAGQPIYTYTFGTGSQKVLYIGGVMRYGGTHKIDEFAIYELIEYLCNDYIVKQSRFLRDLKDNYKIIVLPCIDNVATNNSEQGKNGINNMILNRDKWEIVNGKCQPTAYALSVHDVPIVKNIIDSNKDLKVIVSGGEIMTGYSLNTQDYLTDYETSIIVPKNQSASNLTNYKTYLENDRNEDVVIENTKGTTFGDYAYDNYQIPTYYVQLKVSKKFSKLSEYHTLSEDEYLYCNYEAGRRMANIVNLFLI